MAADIQYPHHRDNLFQLFPHLIQHAVVADHHKGHSGQTGIFRLTDSQGVNVKTTRGQHAGNMGKYPRHVLDKSRYQVPMVGIGHYGKPKGSEDREIWGW
jgi:hypothetical protein